MKTKISTVRVCKQWRDIATKFLYEDVRLENQEVLKSFAWTLTRSSEVTPSNDNAVAWTNHPYSQLTSRLRVTLFQRDRRSRVVEPGEAEENFDNLDTILTLCGNLMALRVMAFRMPPGRKWSEAANRHLRALQSLELDCGYLSDNLLCSVRNSENLEVLSIDDNQRERPRGFIPEPGLSFPKLHTIRLFHLGTELLPDWISTWELPSLSRVTLGIQNDDMEWEVIADQFLLHAQKIKSLDYSPSLNHTTLNILQACPSLVHLVLHYSALQYLDTTCLSAIPELTRLDIRSHGSVHSPAWPSDEGLEAFMEEMRVFLDTAIQPQLPAHLERLRLSDMENSDIQTHSWSDDDVQLWRWWIKAFSGLGVRFEDAWGDPVDIGR
jgi:hypothetical protein